MTLNEPGLQQFQGSCVCKRSLFSSPRMVMTCLRRGWRPHHGGIAAAATAAGLKSLCQAAGRPPRGRQRLRLILLLCSRKR